MRTLIILPILLIVQVKGEHQESKLGVPTACCFPSTFQALGSVCVAFLGNNIVQTSTESLIYAADNQLLKIATNYSITNTNGQKSYGGDIYDFKNVCFLGKFSVKFMNFVPHISLIIKA